MIFYLITEGRPFHLFTDFLSQARDPYQMPDATSHLKVVEPYKTFSITSLMDLNESELQALSEIVALLEEAFH